MDPAPDVTTNQGAALADCIERRRCRAGFAPTLGQPQLRGTSSTFKDGTAGADGERLSVTVRSIGIIDVIRLPRGAFVAAFVAVGECILCSQEIRIRPDIIEEP